MNPEFWAAMRERIARGESEEALHQISTDMKDSLEHDPEAADTIATAIAKQGNLLEAIQLLNQVIVRGSANFHTYYRLAEYHRSLNRVSHAFRYFRLAHAQVSWPESLAHGYSFTHDFFSPVIPCWQKWFRENILCTPIHALEIGSWQGGSAAWLLDKVVSRRGGRLTCVDTFLGSSEHTGIMQTLDNTLEEIFDENIKRTGHGNHLRKIVGRSRDVLPTLFEETFDFIYIDGAHEAKFVIQDALNSWRLLKPGGFMLFNELNFAFVDYPQQNTIRAVDFFLSIYGDELKVVDRLGQLLIQRTS